MLSLVVGALFVNCYIYFCEDTKHCAIIDPGANPDRIMELVRKNSLEPKYILLTHGHFDHIGAVKELKELTGAKVAIHHEDKGMLTDPVLNLSASFGRQSVQVPPDILLEDGSMVKIGNGSLKVIHTPGHTMGGVSFLGDGILFTGDTLFKGTVGRTDLPRADFSTLMKSINEKLMVLDRELVIYPGHGASSTLYDEYSSNPFLIGEEL